MARRSRKDWTPKPPLKPRTELDSIVENWNSELWREADVSEVESGYLIWYGPHGVDGDVATLIELVGDGDFEVSDFQGVEGLLENPEAPILKSTVYFGIDELDAAVDSVEGEDAHIRLLGFSQDELLRFAVGYGIAKLAYSGGEEQFLDDLPR